MECGKIIEFLEKLSPPAAALDWDNVGLLVGRKDREVKKVFVCLDVTEPAIKKAAEQGCDMIVSHHPMLFSAIKKVNDSSVASSKVLFLAENHINCYAMHTNYDTLGGMAELAAGEQYLGLSDVSPIEANACEITGKDEGIGRFGHLPHAMTIDEIAEYVKEKFGIPYVMKYQAYGESKDEKYDKVAILPGSGKSDIDLVANEGVKVFITGDYGHHTGIDAKEMGINVIDATHYGLEHIFIEHITGLLKKEFGEDIEVIPYDEGCPFEVL